MVQNCEQNKTYPLVSFCIVTYNTSKYIEELLECAKNQTYQNLELIVSDDCSTDNTLEIVRNWIAKNGSRFVRTDIVTVDKNTGVAGNKYRAENACRGDYIKSIDGDDLIDADFVEKAVDILEHNTEYSFLYSNTYLLMDYGDRRELQLEDTSGFKSGDVFKELFMVEFWIKPTSWFFRKEVVEQTSYDTSLYLCEDFSRTLDIASRFKIYHWDEYKAYYRRHADNMNPDKEWTKSGMFRYFESQLQAISHYSDYNLFNPRKEWILNQLVMEAKCRKPSYLLKMALRYKRPSYIMEYLSFERKNIRQKIKLTETFKFCRNMKIWRKLKGEL